MLVKIKLDNFKGIKKAELELGEITVLLGPNGTGKSSIIQALMVLRQSIGQSSLIPEGQLIELGAFNDILNKTANVKHIGIGVSVKLKEYENLSIPDGSSYSCDSYWNPSLYKLDAKVESTSKEFVRFSGSDTEGYTLEPDILVPKEHEGENMGIKVRGERGNVSNPMSAAGIYVPKGVERNNALDELLRQCKEESDEIFHTLLNTLSNIYCVPAIRGVEKKAYNLANKYVVDIKTGNNMQLATTFAYASGHVKEMVEKWSGEITGSEIVVNLVSDKQVLIESAAAGGIPVIVDGSGVNQLVQMLLMFGIVPYGSTLGIEEPEIHLHPKAQKKLCSLLAGLVKKEWKRQLIITTHSQYVMFGFLNEVKQGNMDRNELKIYYFEDKEKEPVRVEIDEGGDIYDWGKNFFDYT